MTMDELSPPVFGQRDPQLTYIPRPGAYALAMEGHRLAVVQTAKGYFLPGGGMEAGETAHQALHREIWEECGCTLEILDLIGTAVEYLHTDRGESYELQCSFFRANLGGQTRSPQEIDHTLVWIDVDEAIQVMRRPSQRWAISLIQGEMNDPGS